MIQRTIENKLISLSSQYRVVTVIGPRQSGKSTLCRRCFPDKPVVNLEDPETRRIASLDPKGLLMQFPQGCFIDEIQRCPELLSYIQVEVDEKQIPGQYILSGSQQMLLLDSISQSLAGRTAIIKLLPLSQEELKPLDSDKSINEIITRGSYPEIVSKSLNPTEALSFYVQTYLERDVRQIQAIRDLMVFQNFLSLLAGRSGSIININSLANDIGVSENTVRNWISVAEASFVVFRLKPYYKNLSKRQIKSSKLYFYDTGLLCYLLGIKDQNQLVTHPQKGSIFETYVVSELIKYHYNRAIEPKLYFYADSSVELDVIAETSSGLFPIEIKSSATFREDMLKQISKAKKRIPLREDAALIYSGDKEVLLQKNNITPVCNLAKIGNLILS